MRHVRLLLPAILFVALAVCIPEPHAATTTVPRDAAKYKSILIRASRAVWGLEAPVAVFAAQVHTESWWRNETVSFAGAEGLAQFLPATAKWIGNIDEELKEGKTFNPGWSLRAMVTYDKWLHQRVRGATECDRMALALSAYNGGLGWVQRDTRLAVDRGLQTTRWFGHVATVNAGRSTRAFGENRSYVRLILLERQQIYIHAGWGKGIESCTGKTTGAKP